MEQTQQVKNFHATIKHKSFIKPSFKKQDRTMGQHDHALQALANGEPIPYADTLRVVLCEGSRAPAQAAQVSRRPPGYIRNQLGGFFTS